MDIEEEERFLCIQFIEKQMEIEINAKNSTSQILAWKSEVDKEKKKLLMEELVPKGIL